MPFKQGVVGSIPTRPMTFSPTYECREKGRRLRDGATAVLWKVYVSWGWFAVFVAAIVIICGVATFLVDKTPETKGPFDSGGFWYGPIPPCQGRCARSGAEPTRRHPPCDPRSLW